MVNSAAQKTPPSTTSAASRSERPRSPCRARARAVSALGRSRWSAEGPGPRDQGPGTAASRPWSLAPVLATSDIQHLGQLASPALAGEPQEDVLERAAAGHRRRAQ